MSDQPSVQLAFDGFRRGGPAGFLPVRGSSKNVHLAKGGMFVLTGGAATALSGSVVIVFPGAEIFANSGAVIIAYDGAKVHARIGAKVISPRMIFPEPAPAPASAS